MNSQLQKRKPTLHNSWTELDNLAASSTFDFKGFDHQFIKQKPEFSNLPPKHSLCRTTFWITMDTPGKILVKCNLSLPPQPVDLEKLKAIIDKQDSTEQQEESKYNDPDYISEISSERIQSPIKSFNEPNINYQQIQSNTKDITLLKPEPRPRKSKPNSQRYRFQDWDRRAEERLMKPTGQAKLNQFKRFRETSFRMSNFARVHTESKPSIEEIKKKWVTLTDDIPTHKSSKVPSSATNLQVNSKPNANLNAIGRGAKIFQSNSQPQAEIVKNLEKLVSIPRQPTKSTIGIVVDIAKHAFSDVKPKQPVSVSHIQESPVPSSQSHKKNTKTDQQVVMIPVINVDDPTPALPSKVSSFTIDQNKTPTKPTVSSTFDYQIRCPPFDAGTDCSLKVNYTDSLAEIYTQNPVGSRYYNYKGAPVHMHDKSVMDMLTKFDYTELGEKAKDVALIHGQYTVQSNEHARLIINNSIANSRTRFKYILVKIGLDCALTMEDLMTLEHNEMHMLISFFNVKFCLLQKEDKLKPTDPVERVLKVANKQIENVLQRAYNFKKNEEFLKKKWKEFLKFCKYKIKEESADKSKKCSCRFDDQSRKQ